jgi:hypothetical protein
MSYSVSSGDASNEDRFNLILTILLELNTLNICRSMGLAVHFDRSK